MLTKNEWSQAVERAMNNPLRYAFVVDPNTYLFVKLELSKYRQPDGEWGPWLVTAIAEDDGRTMPIIVEVPVDQAIDLLANMNAESVIRKITKTWFRCHR